MRYLWLAGLVAVVGLVLAAGLRAQDAGRRGEGLRPERGAAGEGRTGEARGGRTRAPAVTLTAEQEEALAPALAELKAAIAKFKEAATAALGETNGPTYTMQVLNEIRRPPRPAAPTTPEAPEAPAEGSTTP